MKTWKDYINESKEEFIIFMDNEPFEVVYGRDVAMANVADYETAHKKSKFLVSPLKTVLPRLKATKPESAKKVEDLQKQNKKVN